MVFKSDQFRIVNLLNALLILSHYRMVFICYQTMAATFITFKTTLTSRYMDHRVTLTFMVWHQYDMDHSMAASSFVKFQNMMWPDLPHIWINMNDLEICPQHGDLQTFQNQGFNCDTNSHRVSDTGIYGGGKISCNTQNTFIHVYNFSYKSMHLYYPILKSEVLLLD